MTGVPGWGDTALFAKKSRSCSRKCHKMCWNLIEEETPGTSRSGRVVTLAGTLRPRQCDPPNGCCGGLLAPRRLSPHWEVPVRRPLASSTQHRLPASRPSALGTAVSGSEVSPGPLFLARRPPPSLPLSQLPADYRADRDRDIETEGQRPRETERREVPEGGRQCPSPLLPKPTQNAFF